VFDDKNFDLENILERYNHNVYARIVRMVSKPGYHCPKCSWSIRQELLTDTIYGCPVCKTKSLVKWDRHKQRFILIENFEKEKEPLRLPKGSVRAIVMLLVISSFCILILQKDEVPNYLLNLALIIVGYYFALRKSIAGHSTYFFDAVKDEKQPLFLPKGWIRGIIIIAFSMTVIYLIMNDRFSNSGLIDFFLIIAGLVAGLLIYKLTYAFRFKKWHIILSHMKATAILLISVILFIAMIIEKDILDALYIRLMVISIGFYFGSR